MLNLKKLHNFFAIIGLIIVGFVSSCGVDDIYHWMETYSKVGKNPYDIKVFYQLLNNTDNGLTDVTNNFVTTVENAEKANYIQFKDNIELDSVKLATLNEFVYNGNNAFFVSNDFPYQVFDLMYRYSQVEYQFNYGAVAQVNFKGSSKKYNFEFVFDHKPKEYAWKYLEFDSLVSDTASNPIVLSYLNDTSINFFKVKYGQGAFYFHCNPVMFSNYHLQNESAFDHAQSFFNEFNEGKVLWDESYKYRQPYQTRYKNESDINNVSAFRLLFSHRGLKWGWFAFLISVVLFLLFKSKREQRIIPVMASNRNESVAFAKNVGNLYFKNGNHSFIAKEMYTLFMHDLRNHYQIDTNKSFEEITMQLAKKSGLPKNEIDNLFQKFELKDNSEAKNNDLIELYELLENFNSKRK